ncbi:MAG: hypothetical protein QOC94_1972, partial [Actinoplanes sp.]|nr:hypothetical protein [Actinoplanes sp.]
MAVADSATPATPGARSADNYVT